VQGSGSSSKATSTYNLGAASGNCWSLRPASCTHPAALLLSSWPSAAISSSWQVTWSKPPKSNLPFKKLCRWWEGWRGGPSTSDASHQKHTCCSQNCFGGGEGMVEVASAPGTSHKPWTCCSWNCLGSGGRAGVGVASANASSLCTAVLPGGYATYLDEVSPGLTPTAKAYKPDNLRQWLRFSANTGHTFDFDYLLLWGGQYLPPIQQGQGWRWVTAGTSVPRGRLQFSQPLSKSYGSTTYVAGLLTS